MGVPYLFLLFFSIDFWVFWVPTILTSLRSSNSCIYDFKQSNIPVGFYVDIYSVYDSSQIFMKLSMPSRIVADNKKLSKKNENVPSIITTFNMAFLAC